MPDISFNCSYCGVAIDADPALAGKVIQCPKCRRAVKVSENLMGKGKVLGGYVLERLLGKGGMGEVWLATQSSTGRKVALKILDVNLSKNPEFTARFGQEMKLVAKLDHPEIVSAYEAGYDKGLYFLATSYVSGSTLEEMLESGKTFGEAEALKIGGKVAGALKYAWDKHKILHRDIKPANIMVDDSGDVKLMDMGISKSLSEDMSITMTGSIIGTPYYMSPEQATSDKDIDCRADIYSLGATLYHILTGSVPFYATTTMGVLTRMISEKLTPARELNPDISPKCEKLIERMMAKNRDLRPATWQEVVDEIRRITETESSRELPVPARERLPGLRMTPLIGSFLIIAIALVIVIAIMGRKREKPEFSDISFEEVIIPEKDLGRKPALADEKREEEKKETPSPAATLKNVHERRSQNREGSAEVARKTLADDGDSFDDKRTAVVQRPPDTAPVPSVKKEDPHNIPTLVKALAENVGISEEQAYRLLPIIRTYGKELRDLKEKAPPSGYRLTELRDKIHMITYTAKKQAETVLTKEQAGRFVMFLEQERRQSFKNAFWHGPGPNPGTGGK